MYALIIVWWPGFTRVIRAEALRIRKLPYIEAAKAAGASDFRIIFKHVLPNCIIVSRQSVTRKIKNLYNVDIDPERVVIMPGGKPTMYYAITLFGELGLSLIHISEPTRPY